MQDQFMPTGGGDICYQLKKGDKTTLMFLHGGGGSISSWVLMKPFFMKMPFTLVFIDLRGHGKSFRPDNWHDYTMEKHADDLSLLFDRLQLKQAFLIGHCLGSMVAATFAADYPEKVAALFLINPGSKNNSILFSFLPELFVSLVQPFTSFFLNTLDPKKAQRAVYFHLKGSADFSLKRIFGFITDVKYMGFTAVFNQARAFLEWDPINIYERIKCPLLIIAGKHDMIFRLRHTLKMHALLTHAKLKILETNHGSIINHPKEIASQILQVINERLS
ncbi:alpha/beta hydrolase [Candidatus Roizmanbacteria bacterium]|nr:alpha/beta hydrolase [Candidatus Roizmanbacteria bacterium]